MYNQCTGQLGGAVEVVWDQKVLVIVLVEICPMLRLGRFAYDPEVLDMGRSHTQYHQNRPQRAWLGSGRVIFSAVAVEVVLQGFSQLVDAPATARFSTATKHNVKA